MNVRIFLLVNVSNVLQVRIHYDWIRSVRAGQSHRAADTYTDYVREEMNRNYVEVFDSNTMYLLLGADLEALETVIESGWTKSVTSGLIPILKSTSYQSINDCWMAVVIDNRFW